MIAFPSMIVDAAKNAGIKIPSDLDDFDKNEFPHWYVFCALQLGRPMRPGAQWDNAKVLAELSEDKIKSMTFEDFEQAGFSF